MKDQSDDPMHHEWMLYHRASSHSEIGEGNSIPKFQAIFIFEIWNSFEKVAEIIKSETFIFFGRYFLSLNWSRYN